MTQPYVGEIRMFAGNFAPAGWEFCHGQTLPIYQYETLFQLIGITYGGNGSSTFGLPDLRGRVPVSMGNGFTLAETGGVEEVTLTANQIPNHGHAFLASSRSATSTNPANRVLGNSGAMRLYTGDAPTASMHVASLWPTGGSQPHSNLQPYLCINYIISLFGIFPSPT